MKWQEITIYTTTLASELVADICWETGGSGVCIFDRNDLNDIKKYDTTWDYIDDGLLNDTSDVVLIKMFVLEPNLQQVLEELELLLVNLKNNSEDLSFGSLEIVTKQIDDEDWINVWKKHYKPIKINGVVICPKWIKFSPTDGEKVVLIDPGMAFGTGEHETTAMCIELVQDFNVQKATVFDIGCGSGILGITAVKLGASKVIMGDIDAVAVEASNYNANLNAVSQMVEIHCCNLLDSLSGKADIIFANITADVLINLSNLIEPFLKDNGAIILSGIIHSRCNQVREAYEKMGLKLVKHLKKGEWNALSFVK